MHVPSGTRPGLHKPDQAQSSLPRGHQPWPAGVTPRPAAPHPLGGPETTLVRPRQGSGLCTSLGSVSGGAASSPHLQRVWQTRDLGSFEPWVEPWLCRYHWKTLDNSLLTATRSLAHSLIHSHKPLRQARLQLSKTQSRDAGHSCAGCIQSQDPKLHPVVAWGCFLLEEGFCVMALTPSLTSGSPWSGAAGASDVKVSIQQ